MIPPIPAGVRAIYFDAVGTLIHPEPPAPVVYAEAGRRYGSRLDVSTISARFRLAFQREEETDRANGWLTSEAREFERWRRIVGEVLSDVDDPEACFQSLFSHFGRPQSWRIDPDAAAVLPALVKQGYALGVASNYDRRLRAVAAGIPGFGPLSHFAVSAEIGWRKPAREFFAALCDQAQLGAAQILLVGDDVVNDYEGAQNAGLHALLVDSKEQYPAHDRIRQLRELLA